MGKEQRAMPAYEIPPALPGDVYFTLSFRTEKNPLRCCIPEIDPPPLAVQAGVIIFE
jgi:hypothetical protein